MDSSRGLHGDSDPLAGLDPLQVVQALEDDQHPRLVHLVLRGMGEVERGARSMLLGYLGSSR
jgi:hypothetical protein